MSLPFNYKIAGTDTFLSNNYKCNNATAVAYLQKKNKYNCPRQ